MILGFLLIFPLHFQLRGVMFANKKWLTISSKREHPYIMQHDDPKRGICLGISGSHRVLCEVKVKPDVLVRQNRRIVHITSIRSLDTNNQTNRGLISTP